MALTLDALGTLLRQSQADIRTLRGEVGALRDEVSAERGATVRAVADIVRASEARIMDRIAALEALVQSKADQA